MQSEQEWDRVAQVAPVDFVPADGSMLSPAGRFDAHVASYEDDHYEDGGTFDSAEAAIRWGRERAPIVIIRLGGSHDTFFSAGDVHAENEDGTPFPLWPPHEPPSGWWHPSDEPPQETPRWPPRWLVSRRRS
jgi:hypothetical protein